MWKITGTLAAVMLLVALASPQPAQAGGRADGLHNPAPQATEFSSRHRRWHRPRVVVHYVHGPRRYYHRRDWRPRYAYPYRYYHRRYWGPGYYAYAGQPYWYYHRPRYYHRPGITFHFGF